MNSRLTEINRHIDENMDAYVEDLRSFIRQPSISATHEGIEEAAEKVKRFMGDVGIEAKVFPTDGNPVVYGKLAFQGNERTLLIYAHYDVAAVDPLNAWTVQPFEANIVDDKIYGRGSADAKANLMSWIKGINSYLRVIGRVPVNLLFVFEGEEEVGSPNLEKFVHENKHLFEDADGKIMADVRQEADGQPIVNLGWVGWLYLETTVHGLSHDIHSSYAPVVENPAWRLIHALNTLCRDDTILIEGFHDDIDYPSEEDLELLSRVSFNEKELASALGVKSFRKGIKGGEVSKKLFTASALNVAGLVSGYVKEGVKASIPSAATAKIEFRLLPKQESGDVLEKLKKHLAEKGFKDVEIKKLAAMEWSKTAYKEKIVQDVIESARTVYGVNPVIYPMLKGPAPDYIFTRLLHLPSVGCGCGYSYVAHKPNEFIKIDQFNKGIKLAATIMEKFGQT